jgi:outer membrane protein assembly factor BamE (lipoprotein component of BamABCDE complex)
MNSRRQLPLVATLLAASLILPSCLVGSSSTTESSGRFVSAETLGRVSVGESESFVQSLLGEPSEKIDSSTGGQIWKWAYSSTTKKTGGVFLLASSSNSSSETGATYVEFQDSKVIRSWRD